MNINGILVLKIYAGINTNCCLSTSSAVYDTIKDTNKYCFRSVQQSSAKKNVTCTSHFHVSNTTPVRFVTYRAHLYHIQYQIKSCLFHLQSVSFEEKNFKCVLRPKKVYVRKPDSTYFSKEIYLPYLTFTNALP